MNNYEQDRIRLEVALSKFYAVRVGRQFDPFTDANDDYAVLEWMREEFARRLASDADCDSAWALREAVADQIWQSEYGERLAPRSAQLTASMGYRIGDYARAALKVLDE